MKKKLSLLLLISILASAIYTVPVSAANTTDTTWGSSMSYNSGTTPARSKENSTSVYVHVQMMSTAYINAYTLRGSDNSNQTKNGVAKLRTTGKYSIYNYIYETGGRSAKLKYVLASTGSALGVWSPDSVGSYTVPNP